MAGSLATLGGASRFTGSAGNARAREYCASTLRTLGYAVNAREFSFSAFTGLYATPLVGAWSAFALLAACAIASMGHPAVGFGVLAGAAAALWAFARYVSGSAILDRSAMRRTGTSLVATRSAEPPRVWLVAHIDSKWQPISILQRAAGIVVLSASALGLMVVLAISVVTTPIANEVLCGIMVVGLVGALPVMLSIVRDGSPGAGDNASGVASVLRAAELIGEDPRVGVLITDAEELGLAGAYAFARDATPAIALNCDTVDDAGPLTVMTVRGSRNETVAALVRTSSAMAINLRVMRLLPGVLTDSVAFSSAGWDTVTVSAGNWRTLARIHTRRDSLAHMRGDQIEVVAEVIARAAKELV